MFGMEQKRGIIMRIFVCDDEMKMADSIENILHKYIENVEVQVFYKGHDVWEALNTDVCDAVFLDIDMPDISGLDIAAKMKEITYKPNLIFVTSHDELVYDSLKFHPFGFVRKNYLQKEMEIILEDLKKNMKEKIKEFSFVCKEGNMRLLLDDILYFEAEGNYLIINTKNEQFKYRNTMYAVEEKLAEYGFVRVHKGYLINQVAVKILGKEEIVLNNDERIPIGKSYAEDAKKRRYAEWIIKR